MDYIKQKEKNISTEKANELRSILLSENPKLAEILNQSPSPLVSLERLKHWVVANLRHSPTGYRFYKSNSFDRKAFEELSWKDMAAIRILEYINNEGREFEDLNLRGQAVVIKPFTQLWQEVHREGSRCSADYYEDMIMLFRQFRGVLKLKKPDRQTVENWMERWPAGTDPRIIALRKQNKDRIIRIFLRKIEAGEVKDPRYELEAHLTEQQKIRQIEKWWNHPKFHLKFAVRDPDELNEYLDYSLDKKTMRLLHTAQKKGIPFFVNLYYLSLLLVHPPKDLKGSDQAIRDYVFYSEALIHEYGHIVAWEREDEVEPGKPNAAGWILPGSHNIHRRYPEVAILIPDTVGRACGGLCVSCQRMYDFQRGNLNFNLDKLRPRETWGQKMERLLRYWEEDSQLRDILITGGDALMSSDESLEKILNGVLQMARNKIEANKGREAGQKYAEMRRIRLGTRLPVYLPQRIHGDLIRVLSTFRKEARQLGFAQFFIQTHFESPMEVTPEAAEGIRKLIAAGWTVTNQMVFTAAASRRGHSAKLRKVLNDLGVINYYTFSVKGYTENMFNFATNERAMQEQLEEKALGRIPAEFYDEIRKYPEDPENIVARINDLRERAGIPYLGTDRNVLNLPGVGKSLTFKTIGITRYGRRVLEFDYDKARAHSPITKELGKVIIIESKSILEYLKQLESYGEDINEYESIWGYSVGVTEPKNPMYDYPAFDYELTGEYTHLGG